MQLENVDIGFNTLGHVLCASLAQHDALTTGVCAAYKAGAREICTATESCAAFTANAVRDTHDRVELVYWHLHCDCRRRRTEHLNPHAAITAGPRGAHVTTDAGEVTSMAALLWRSMLS